MGVGPQHWEIHGYAMGTGIATGCIYGYWGYGGYVYCCGHGGGWYTCDLGGVDICGYGACGAV